MRLWKFPFCCFSFISETGSRSFECEDEGELTGGLRRENV